jgi:CheY-like chemotaxis protein
VAIARARQALEAGAGAIQAVLLDLTMPGLPGRMVLEQLRALDPGIRIILSSGFANDVPAAPGVEFLPKPYAPRALLDLLRTVLDRPQAGEARLGETIPG